MAKTNDGWKVVGDYFVYVKDNKVQKGIQILDHNRYKTVYPYKRTMFGAQRIEVTLSTFRDGVRDGRYFMREAYA